MALLDHDILLDGPWRWSRRVVDDATVLIATAAVSP
jgi:hypothetical protein